MSDIIVLGGSAGSIEPLREILRELPPSLPASIFVVVHTLPDAPSVLPAILGKASPLETHHARDGQKIERGMVYVAPPDHHLSLEAGRIRVHRGPRENTHRPSIDVLFRSAAESYGSRVVGVLLSGMGGDGAVGLSRIKALGGRIILQSAEEAQFPKMLREAARLSKPDFELPVGDIPDVLYRLVMEEHYSEETIAMERQVSTGLEGKQPTEFSCPECGGVLWADDEGQLVGMRCRVGHVYSYDSLLLDQTRHVESALWAGLRALEEKAALLNRMAITTRSKGQNLAAQRFAAGAQELEQPAETIRRLLNGFELYEQPQREDMPGEKVPD